MSSTGDAIAFGTFRLLPSQQLLLDGDKPLRLGSRALDILIALVERAGELIGKDELIARVWPNVVVDEGSLRVHVAALRRALGDGQAGNRYVATIPGRGYRFVAPVTRSRAEEPQPSAPRPAAERAHNLPALLTRMVGRADIVGALAAQLPRQRFVTIVGPGGIGKTTVALATADAVMPAYEHGVAFVDLAPLADPLLVPSALASALGLAIRSESPIPGLIAFLKDRRMLLVLDSCEHVVAAAATLAEAVFKGAPGVHILATSREPLRAEGERVQRLSPLAIPPASASLTAAEALAFPAVELLVERAAASLDTFELTDADAPIVADICRRLDGIALAIELAAGRVDVLGVRGLAARLDDRFRLLTRGRRTALPRHQTLGAMLDWSYELLDEPERVILRRLSVFAGGFTLESARAVAASACSGEVDAGSQTTACATHESGIAETDVVDQIANLVAKSLVAADVGGAIVHYRLLDTTRAYALEKLAASGELDAFARRHAEHHRDLFERAEAESATRPADEWLAAYGRQIDNLRAALDWACSPSGDPAIGVALTVAAVPLWTHLSLMEECRQRVQRALLSLGPEAGRGGRREMQLFAALGAALLYTKGPGPENEAAWMNALQIAESLDDIDYRLRALWGLLVNCINRAEFQRALALAREFRAIAVQSPDPGDLLIGDRLVGVALHFLGDQTNARRLIDGMLERYVAPIHRSHTTRFRFDQQAAAHLFQARILWLQGFPDQAMRVVESSVAEARSIDHALSLCTVLAQAACPIAIEVGDLAAAERFVAMLLDLSARQALTLWHLWARSFAGVVRIRRGDVASGLHALRSALDELPATGFALRYPVFLGELAEGLAAAGQVDQGLAAIEDALERCERTAERWCIAELTRIKGEIVLQQGAANAAAAAEEHFRRALDWAREQEVLLCELRAAMSLARLQREQGRIAEARDLLASVYGRFGEGFETADLRMAKSLLDELA